MTTDRSGDQPWAPFPVQDWSTMPVDPMWSAPSGPVIQPPRWWPPLIVFAVIGALIAGLAYVGAAVGYAAPTTAAAFLPDDGEVAYEREVATRASGTAVSNHVTESAILTGAAAYFSADSTFTAAAFASVRDVQTLRVWRTISTPADSGSPSVQTTREYQVNDAVVLLGESTPTAGYAYTPGLVELPAHVAAGQEWSSDGSAGAVLSYHSTFRSAADGDDCLKVTGEITYRSRTAGTSSTAAVERRWCRGQGIMTQSNTVGDTRTVVDRVTRADVAIPPPTTVDRPVTWTDYASWQPHTLTVRSVDANFGEGMMTGAATGALAPVQLASGLVVRAMKAPDDLVALKPRTAATWGTVWRTHPGGSIVSLTRFGDVVLVSTSLRRLVAYSANGARLWERQLAEIAPTEPVRVSETAAALVDLGGTVVDVDLATGKAAWSTDVGSDVSRAPVIGDGVVVVMDRGGTVHALDAANGAVRWTKELAGEAGTVVGPLTVIVQDQTAHALNASTGRTVWLRPFIGTLTGAAVVGDNVVIGTKSGTQLVNGTTGAIAGRIEPSYRLTPLGDQLISWGAAEAVLISPDGVTMHRWATSEISVASEDRLAVATPRGPQLHNADWTFTEWSSPS